MINKDTAIASNKTSLMMANKNLTIKAQSGTPLGELVGISMTLANIGRSTVSPDTDDLTIIDQFLVDNASVLEACTIGFGEALSNHDIVFDSYVTSISSAVQQHISFAKNVVAPVVLAMSKETMTMMGVKSSAASMFNIETIDLPAPMTNGDFEGTLATYKGKPRVVPENKLTFEQKTIDDLIVLMKTGSADYDKCLLEWVASKPVGFFINLWTNVFMNRACALSSDNFDIEDLFNDEKKYVDHALFVYLVSRKLFDVVPKDSEMSLTRYKDLINQNLTYSADKLMGAYKKYNSDIKAKVLVSSIDRQQKTISVNGAVYREWVSTGGKNEVLLGLVVSNDNYFTSPQIDKNSQVYYDSWLTYEQFTALAEKNRSFTLFKEYLTIAFSNGMKDMNMQEISIAETLPGVSQNISKYFFENLALITSGDLADVHEVCLRLVCRSRFYYTDSEKILRGINEAFKTNPSIDVRQAALLSMIEYVTDYVVDQMTVSS